MVNTVCLIQTRDFGEQGIKKAVFEAFDLLDFKPPDPPKKVAIKVNLCYYWDYSTGQTTDPRVTSATIDYIREHWNDEASIHIVESDASAVRMKYAFKMLGYEELAAKKAVHLSNLSLEPSQEVTVPINTNKYTFRVPEVISSADVFISIPKLKMHGLTAISCGLKNQYGCNPEWKKVTYHPKLDEVICALNKLMKADVTLVDGVVVAGHSTKKMGLIMTGTDPVAVDFTAAKILGVDPLRVGHLQLATKEKIGSVNDIALLGENIDNIRALFPRPPPPLSKSTWFLINVKRLFLALLGE